MTNVGRRLGVSNKTTEGLRPAADAWRGHQRSFVIGYFVIRHFIDISTLPHGWSLMIESSAKGEAGP
jgi:hypothetical protein